MQNQLSKTELINGALWGAVLGDVIGAHLEFDKDLNATKISNAFKIVGGGKHHLDPGQPTDDSQLNFSILKGLVRGKGTLNLNFIAQQMGNWFLSKPFDVGNTIRNSVPKACNMKVHQAHLCRKGASQRSQTSQSNGTLMALIGISLWCHNLNPSQIAQAIRQVTILVHPNQLVILSNIFYALLVKYLLSNPSQGDKGIKAFEYAKLNIFQYTKNIEFKEWIKIIQDSFDDLQILDKHCSINKTSGWVRVALSYSTYFLVQGKSYKESIQWIISQKGDTDTNACIMGGLLGAFYGIKQLKMEHQILKIEHWRSNKRPEWLNPGKVIPVYSQFLLQHSPVQLKMLGNLQQYANLKKK